MCAGFWKVLVLHAGPRGLLADSVWLLVSEAMRYSSMGRFQEVRAHFGHRVGMRLMRRTHRCSQRVQVHTLSARFCSCCVSVSFCVRYAVNNLRNTACDSLSFMLYLVRCRELVGSAPACCIVIDIYSSCQELFRMCATRLFFHRRPQLFHSFFTAFSTTKMSESPI